MLNRSRGRESHRRERMLSCVLCCAQLPKKKGWKPRVREIVRRMRSSGWDCLVQPGPYQTSLQISAVHLRVSVYCTISQDLGGYCTVRMQSQAPTLCANAIELDNVLAEALAAASGGASETKDLTVGQSRPHPQ